MARRLSFTKKGGNVSDVDWAALQGGLATCESWPATSKWLAYLVVALKSDSTIPFVNYAKEVIKRASPIAELAISQADLVEEEDCGMVVRRLGDDISDNAFAWMHEALLSWAPWKPHVDSELFDIQFAGDGRSMNFLVNRHRLTPKRRWTD